MTCREVEPQVEQPLAAPTLEDPAALPPASDPSAPSRPVGSFLAPPTFGITGYPRPTGSVVAPPTPRTYNLLMPSAELCPSSPYGFLPLAWPLSSVAPVLRYSGSTYDARHRDIAWVSSSSNFAQLLQRPSICTFRSGALRWSPPPQTSATTLM